MDIFCGVDGCHAGWIVVSCDSQLCLQSAELKEDIQEILDYTRGAALTLIDIPIGLKDREQPGRRTCDVGARKILGKHASSVFTAPQREALKAETWEGEKGANSINKEICGMGLSMQTWGITKKNCKCGFYINSRCVLTVEVERDTSRNLLLEFEQSACNEALEKERGSR